jgi:hypothetical protein
MKYKKPTLNDTIRANEKALRGLCMLGGKPMPEGFDTPAVERKTRAPAKPSEVPIEHDEQRAFVKWFRLQYPKVLIFAVPNAGQRDHNAASWMKAEGLVAGVPDLIVPEWKLVIEMKRIKGSTISPEQYWMEEYFKRIGWTHFFAYGAEDAKQKLMSIPK